MANKTPLAAWLYSKSDELNPRFEEFTWPKRRLPGVFDFSTTITWKGFVADGRGLDEKREIALEKSVAESIERLVCKIHGVGSVGLAVGSAFDPSQHARHELLERHFLNRHIETRTLFLKLEECPELARRFVSLNPGAGVDFYRMATPANLNGVVCSITSSENQKASLGFALSEDLETSLRRSFFEALPNFAWLMRASAETENIASSIPWHIQAEYLEQIQPLFSDKMTLQDPDVFALPCVNEVRIDHTALEVLSDAPIRIARFVEGLK